MEEEDKLPLKRVELSLSKFNEVAIPHHLDLLRQHKANIIKYEEAEDWPRVRVEQTSARRAAAQLRVLLAELDALRRRVRAEDVPRFDARTRRARDLTHRAVMDYLESSPVAMERARPQAPAGSAASTDSVGVVAHAAGRDPEDAGPGREDGGRTLDLGAELTQLQIDEQEANLREREAVLRGWRSLQLELRALHDAWQCVQAAALAQRERVDAAAAGAGAAADDVHAARSHLAAAERLRAGAWGAGGAVAGAIVGGPVGLVVGAKAGAAAALAGSALGYLAARLLGRRRGLQLADADPQGDKKEQ